MYGLFHDGYAFERWQVFIVYLIITWLACFVVMFANRALPKLTSIGLFFILMGVFITIMVCAIMPSRTGKGYASNDFVWKEWQNQAGWSSDGLVFCLGMLNGAFAVGTPLVLPPSNSCPSPIPSYDEDANPDVIGTAYPTSQKNSPTLAPTSPRPSSPNTPWAS
jgi:hypothetical protein